MPRLPCSYCGEIVVRLTLHNQGGIIRCRKCKNFMDMKYYKKYMQWERFIPFMWEKLGVRVRLVADPKMFVQQKDIYFSRSFDGWMWWEGENGERSSKRYRFKLLMPGKTGEKGAGAQMYILWEPRKERIKWISRCFRLYGKRVLLRINNKPDEGAFVAKEECECGLCDLAAQMNEICKEEGIEV